MQSLAVLPLQNLSQDPQQEYFVDGMTDELIARLSRIESLRVISRTSVMGYKNVKKPIREIAKELNVDGVIEGSVLPAGDRVRITLQMIDARSDRHLWAESYEHDLKDILAIQNEVALSVAREIKIKLTPQAQAHLTSSSAVRPEAYQAYLRAIEYSKYFDFNPKSIEVALNLLQKTIELDPTFAPAYARLSRLHSYIYFNEVDPSQERLSKAKKSVDRAFELQPELPENHLALAYYYYWGLMNYSEALKEFEIVKKNTPSNTAALKGIVLIRRRQGYFQEALQRAKEAVSLSPNDLEIVALVAETYIHMGRYEEAINWSNRAILLEPDHQGPYGIKASSYVLWKGDVKTAREVLNAMPVKEGIEFDNFAFDLAERDYKSALRHLSKLQPREDWQSAFADYSRGHVYRLMNQPESARLTFESARRVTEKRLTHYPEDSYAHALLGKIYAGLGLKEAAIREGKWGVEKFPVSKDAVYGPSLVLDLAIIYTTLGEQDAALHQIEYLLSIPPGASGFSAYTLKINPQFDPLRSHPRFQKLLAKHSVSK